MVRFTDVHQLLNSHGWQLYSIAKPYFVFYKDGDPHTGLPILVEVRDKRVDPSHVEKIRAILEGENETAA